MSHDLSMMNKMEFSIDGRRCVAFSDQSPETLLIEPMDDHDLSFLDREISVLNERCGIPFCFAALIVNDWEMDLTPWRAEPVFGKKSFGEGAADTLRLIEERLIPEMELRIPSLHGRPRVLGGYSLSAFFALWCSYQTDTFSGIAAASPSVWYPGWLDFAKVRTPKAKKIYLSLGDTEYKSKNKILASVEECIKEYSALLSQEGVENVLEWNEGNHFTDTDLRTARAFIWAMR